MYFHRALEADRYNHVTATYFLLAERILREKQSHSPSLVYNLAQHVQSRQVPRVLGLFFMQMFCRVTVMGAESLFLSLSPSLDQEHIQ